ncbi:type II toxin-antitoxin system RelE family toxin [Methylorubrum populi]|uniref:type II toxin-antitoxin system RelE family toxin n=1 Tax=Methylorubrum TaxID=2282523 RepID=UPI0011529F4B|nr:type II toxin-antitoxin system RelE/ParE family toxin [Methylorubrum populi]QDI81928.1 type II toxin-antitoxin system RelE/ParE family toxin [Methylorubrum populi]
MKTLLYTAAALKSLTKLSKPAQADILAKLERYATTGSGSTKALIGRPGVRLRVGDYRVVFTETADTISVFAIGDRRDIYT